MACQEKKKCTVPTEESERLLTEVATNSFILVSVQCIKIAHCTVIRNLESGKFVLVESGILGFGIRNPVQ